MRDETFYNRVGGPRIDARQIDELIGLARGIAADGSVNQSEAEFLEKWLVANLAIRHNPMVAILYTRVQAMLQDGILDVEEQKELLDTLNGLAMTDMELGETMKPTTLPLCDPAPALTFPSQRYCFTGTFVFGTREACHSAVEALGAVAGSLTKNTSVLVIGSYATESWKHSSFGDKIMRAAEMRGKGTPIRIVSEDHWKGHMPA